MMLFGFASLEAQNTGYVTVSWDACSECCIGMEYYVCITVMRVSDRYVVVENVCEIVDGDQDHFDFEFEMPSCPTNEDFIVFATLRAECNQSTLCCYAKNEGVTGPCSDLVGNTFEEVPITYVE